jgi:hypothetical protein
VSLSYKIAKIIKELDSEMRIFEEFRIGKVCKDTSEIVENLQNISSSQIEIWKNNFSEYNNYRNETNILFLDINQGGLPC